MLVAADHQGVGTILSNLQLEGDGIWLHSSNPLEEESSCSHNYNRGLKRIDFWLYLCAYSESSSSGRHAMHKLSLKK